MELYLLTMIKIVVNDIDKDIIKKIYENEMITLSLLTPELSEYHRSLIWKRIDMLKIAGIIETLDGMYKITDNIDISKLDKTNEIFIKPNMLKLAEEHIEILKLLKDRDKKTKFAFIRHKLNHYTQWKLLHVLEELCFLGFVRKERKGIYEITDEGRGFIKKWRKHHLS